MKEYRKKLIIESVALGIISAVLIAVQVLAFCRVLEPITGDSHYVDFWNGMVAGAGFGLTLMFVAGIVVNIRAIRKDSRLKKLYAKEHDERREQIYLRAQSMGMRISVSLMLAAGIVLGYFDIGMSVICLACALVQSVITGLGKLYWSRKL